MKILSIAIMCLFLLAAGSGAASAQTAGPVAPPPKYEVKRVPAQPVDVKAPPIPADEIIRRFAANEDVMKK
ncbi:MAG: hypothetical protein WAN13_17940, partial [Candidatus Acidiferrales bacterium]